MPSKNTTHVYIDLYGMFRWMTGKKRCELSVTPVLQEAVKEVKEYLATINVSSSYILYINNTFVPSALKQNPDAVISEDDVFKVIPIVAGG
jgi:hypothetical protein